MTMSDVSQADLATISEELASFFADPSKFPDPYPMFRRLRELDPVHWSRYETWVVSGYPEALEILKHPAMARESSAEQQFRHVGRRDIDAADVVAAVDIWLASLINRDPPAHTRLRRLVARAFTPRAVASWQPRIDAVVAELVDGVLDRDEFDLLADLAYPLPEVVICELLGVPVEDLRSITSTMGDSRIMTARGSDTVAGPAEELRRETQHKLVGQVEYFRDVVAERRRNPREDLISTLVQVEDEGDRLTMDELIGTVIVLIGAGHETTANLIGNGALALLRHRDQFALLQNDPGLLPHALEEILRHESPSRGQPRMASERVEVAGRTIEAGQQVSVILNAANRDPRIFENPDEFDITRFTRDAPPHITFTAGVHYCLGASLAKAEASSMFAALASRLGDIELATEDVEWRPAYVRGLVALPVVRGPRASTMTKENG